jgi:hypothetical protein
MKLVYDRSKEDAVVLVASLGIFSNENLLTIPNFPNHLIPN